MHEKHPELAGNSLDASIDLEEPSHDPNLPIHNAYAKGVVANLTEGEVESRAGERGEDS